MYLPHMDITFHLKALNILKYDTTLELRQEYGNVYLHFIIRCVQEYNVDMNVKDITIGDDTFALLSTDHMHFLKHNRLLQTLVAILKSSKSSVLSALVSTTFM